MADTDHRRRATASNRKKSPQPEKPASPFGIWPKPKARPRPPSKRDFPYTVLAQRLEEYAATLKPLPPLRPRSARRPETCTVASTYYEARRGESRDFLIPSLRLSGKWLEDIGFAIGAKVRVEVEAGALKLTVVPAESEPTG